MIQLLYSQLRYDIEQQTYQIAELRLSDKPDIKGKTQIDETQSLSDLALRFCEEGVALLRTLLREKTRETDASIPNPPFQPNDTLPIEKDEDQQDIPPTWQFTLMDNLLDEHTIATLMHRFVVAYVLWQLAKLHFPNEAASLQKQYNDIKDELEDAMYSLGTPRKHRPILCQTMRPQVSIEFEQE